MERKLTWMAEERIKELSQVLAQHPNEHWAWLRRLEAEGSLGFTNFEGIVGVLYELMDRGLVSREVVLDVLADAALVGRVGHGRYRIEAVQTRDGGNAFFVRDETGAFREAFDSLPEAVDYIEFATRRDDEGYTSRRGSRDWEWTRYQRRARRQAAAQRQFSVLIPV